MALVPKEAVHRTVNQGAERLRTQIRQVAQEGKRDTFGGDQIEDRTVDGSQLAARGAVRLAKQVQKNRTAASLSAAESFPSANKQGSSGEKSSATVAAPRKQPADG